MTYYPRFANLIDSSRANQKIGSQTKTKQQGETRNIKNTNKKPTLKVFNKSLKKKIEHRIRSSKKEAVTNMLKYCLDALNDIQIRLNTISNV